MKFRVEVICLNHEGAEQRHDVMEIERRGLAMETLGLNLAEGKAVLKGVQEFSVAQQSPSISSSGAAVRIAAKRVPARGRARSP